MDVFFAHDPAPVRAQEIFLSLKRVLAGRLGSTELNPALSLESAQSGQFFLKNTEALVWGRIFYDRVYHRDLGILREEIACMLKIFKQDVRAYIFFPSCAVLDPRSFEGFQIKCHFFEYFCLESLDAEAVGIRPWNPPLGSEEKSSRTDCAPEEEPPQVPAPAIRAGSLTREELQELISLSLDLSRGESGNHRSGGLSRAVPPF